MKVHTCPKCGTTARNENQLEKKFGWRVTSSVGYVPQSWCKECRNKPKTKLPVPFKLNKSQKAVMAEIEKNAGQPIRVQKFPFVTVEQQMQIDGRSTVLKDAFAIAKDATRSEPERVQALKQLKAKRKLELATEAAKDVRLNRAILEGMNRDDLKSEYAKHFPGDTNKDRRSYRFMFSKLERKLRR